MAKASLRIMRSGEPVSGAKVTVGENLKEFITDTQGRVIRTVPEDWGPIAALVIIEGEGFCMGGGPHKIERDKELVIEI